MFVKTQMGNELINLDTVREIRIEGIGSKYDKDCRMIVRFIDGGEDTITYYESEGDINRCFDELIQAIKDGKPYYEVSI